MDSDDIKYVEEFIAIKDGTKRFTCSWLPSSIKALVFFCHGYAMESSISMKDPAYRLAKAGYGVYGFDYVGHGRSEGLAGYIPSFDDLVNEVSDHYTSVCEKEENKNKARYLMGESMGGAVVLLLHRKKPEFWDGAILVAPMCQLAEQMKPGPFAVKFLTGVSKLVPTWKLVPSQDIIEAAVRDPEAKKRVRANPYWYTDRPRLKTAQELYTVATDLEQRLGEVRLPFLVVHGGDDRVTDPSTSKLLYETAVSGDKTFKLYDGMWHALTYGELPENIDRVFGDIVEWLDYRMKGGDDDEMERKLVEDVDVNNTNVEVKEEDGGVVAESSS